MPHTELTIGWIDATKQLPDIDEPVYALRPGYKMAVPCSVMQVREGGAYWRVWPQHNQFFPDNLFSDITHWHYPLKLPSEYPAESE